MRIRELFHKIKMGFVRARESSIPYVNEAKRYGNYGEDEFTYRLRRELPSCKIKRNVVISTPDGNAEIDCLVLAYQFQQRRFMIGIFQEVCIEASQSTVGIRDCFLIIAVQVGIIN